MKFFLVTLGLVVCVLGYVHEKEPHLWNTGLAALKVPEAGHAMAEPDAPSSEMPADAEPVQPARDRTVPEIISPDSTHINPDHVHQVEQPGEIPAPTNSSAGSTNAGASVPADQMPPVAKIPGLTPSTIPSTITTISGTTYTGCVLSRITPAGISFAHSTGVSKVSFTDLDPAYGATFGYDSAQAKKYEQEQALQEAQSDANRANAATASVQPTSAAPAPYSPPAANTRPVLSEAQRAAVQKQIADLQSDIAQMQREQSEIDSENQRSLISGHGHASSGNGFRDKIADDQAQIGQLQTQLNP